MPVSETRIDKVLNENKKLFFNGFGGFFINKMDLRFEIGIVPLLF